jgi:hypothetical protein
VVDVALVGDAPVVDVALVDVALVDVALVDDASPMREENVHVSGRALRTASMCASSARDGCHRHVAR